MNHSSSRARRAILAMAVALPSLLVAQTVDYPSSTQASPPQVGFPFYTPGGGSTGQTVRIQCLCPDAFLSAQNLGAGLVTKVGVSLGGQAAYDQLVLRAGTTAVATLGSDWSVNLPDQRVQRDLSNQVLQGGGTLASPVNQWVEYELDYPFYYQPGANVVIDVIAHIAVSGVYCGTTLGNGQVARAYNFSYAPGAPATNWSSGGIAFRLVFAPPQLVTFGSGCPGTANATPVLGAIGQPQIGTTVVLTADQALAGAIGGFVLGLSRTEHLGVPLPAALGGGCSLLVSADVFVPMPIQPTGAGSGTSALAVAIPADPLLSGFVLYAQFAQFDPASAAVVPLVFSNGGMLSIF